uniref:Uncharacterized protein n=1 Tax=Rhizochromulina marina TaxID=1034831 RepID=A0A7S2SWN8_9STRA|mmetsp:Transcript_9597/g.27207  ORF Transcript_9597/g.27207 Transcript_9597/m.27207 type:complete len:354 (+) Transcript_9597:269-1330(+)
MESLALGRPLVISSTIIQRFCGVLDCRLEPLENPVEGTRDDVIRSHFFTAKLRRVEVPEGLEWIQTAGCLAGEGWSPHAPTSDEEQQGLGATCIYRKLIQGLVRGPGEHLSPESVHELSKRYTGSSRLFSEIMQAPAPKGSSFHFDTVIHLRTLSLIEDLDTEDGFPVGVKDKTEAFLKSRGFRTMLECIAKQIEKQLAVRPEDKRPYPLRVYIATDAVFLRTHLAEELTQRLEVMCSSHARDHSTAPICKSPSVEFLNTKPAHFFLWTPGDAHAPPPVDWPALTSTVAEWLLMAQGEEMLTVKGLEGGRGALVSSFAGSAAAFGRTKSVSLLRKSSTSTCDWVEVMEFPSPP